MMSGEMVMDTPEGISLKPGETKELTHTFATAGQTLAGCRVAGHYGGGMKAGITVSGQGMVPSEGMTPLVAGCYRTLPNLELVRHEASRERLAPGGWLRRRRAGSRRYRPAAPLRRAPTMPPRD